MAGITIDPKLAGFGESQPAPAPQTIGGGVTIDPSMVDFSATQQQSQPTAQAPSGFEKGLSDPLYAISQIVAKGMAQLPESMTVNGIPVARAGRYFNEQFVPQEESTYQAKRAAAGETGLDYGRMGGNVLTAAVPGGLIAKGAGLVAPASRGIQAALSGGVSSALMTPVESATDFWQNKAQQTGAGALTGYGLDKTLGAVVSPALSDAARRMKDMGVTLTPGQMFGGLTESIENAVAKLPIIGSTARAAQDRSVNEFNTGVINSALSKIDESLPKGVSGFDAVEYLYKKADESFDKVKPKVELGNTLNLYTGLRDIANNFKTSNEGHVKFIKDFIKDNIQDKLSKGAISGDDFKKLDSDLGKKLVNYAGKGGADADLADAIGSLQRLIRSELRPIDPTDTVSKKALDAANSVWADKSRIQRAASYLSADDGVFTPSQLNQAVKAESTGNSQFATGNARMQGISRDALNTIGRTGTVTPNQIGQTVELGSGGAALAALSQGALPLTSALALAPLPFYTRPAQNVFNAVMGRQSLTSPFARQAIPTLASPGITGGLLRDEQIPRIEMTGMAR